MTTILLVEDAQDLAQVIVRDLRTEGYDVLHVADGLTALQLHAKHEPDLVILDWMLPKLDGMAVLRQIRQSSPVPVLMLTARTEETDMGGAVDVQSAVGEGSCFTVRLPRGSSEK